MLSEFQRQLRNTNKKNQIKRESWNCDLQSKESFQLGYFEIAVEFVQAI